MKNAGKNEKEEMEIEQGKKGAKKWFRQKFSFINSCIYEFQSKIKKYCWIFWWIKYLSFQKDEIRKVNKVSYPSDNTHIDQ